MSYALPVAARMRYALAVWAVVAGGCAAPGSPSLVAKTAWTDPTALFARATRPGVTISRIAYRPTGTTPSYRNENTKTESLLYLGSGDGTFVLTYPALGFSDIFLDTTASETFLCSDKVGNVWVTEFNNYDVLEYAHGGQRPLKTINDIARYPIGCSVDPTSGNLAVANLTGATGNPGSIFVFTPTGGFRSYASPKYANFWPPGYDDQGNLFVETALSSGSYQLVELPKGGDRLRTVRMNRAIHYAAGVQWDGQYLAVGDQMYEGRDVSGVYRVKVTGGRANVVSSLELSGTCGASDILQFWIVGNRLVGPDFNCSTVGIYRYPAGGNPDERVSGYNFISGATVSLAK